MSLINRIFFANITDAGFDESSLSHVFEFGGITDLDLSNLFAIVTDEPFDFDSHELHYIEIDGIETDGEHGELFELPKRFVEAFYQISDENLSEIAKKWANSEELDCDGDDLLPILNHLKDCATHYKKSPQALYFEVAL